MDELETVEKKHSVMLRQPSALPESWIAACLYQRLPVWCWARNLHFYRPLCVPVYWPTVFRVHRWSQDALMRYIENFCFQALYHYLVVSTLWPFLVLICISIPMCKIVMIIQFILAHCIVMDTPSDHNFCKEQRQSSCVTVSLGCKHKSILCAKITVHFEVSKKC